MILLLQKILNIIIFILHTVIFIKSKEISKDYKYLECFYGDKFLAGIEKDNFFFGLQFHPEKKVSLMVLKFLKIFINYNVKEKNNFFVYYTKMEILFRVEILLQIQ